MVMKQENKKECKINVENVEDATIEFEESIPEDPAIVDESETFLQFNILSDSTAEIKTGYDGDNNSYIECDFIIIPQKIRIDENVYIVTSIGDSAFLFCSSLAKIEIPTSVTNIDESVFWGCENLTNIEISENITKIENYVFLVDLIWKDRFGKTTYNKC